MADSSLWMKKDGTQQHPEEKDDRQQPLDEEGWKTAASGGKRRKKDGWQTVISGQTDKRGQKGRRNIGAWQMFQLSAYLYSCPQIYRGSVSGEFGRNFKSRGADGMIRESC